MRISVVIPTYNRGPKLGDTLDALLASETAGLDEVEVIVVDDGSPTPAAPVVEARHVAGPFSLRCIRQQNAGPAKARNTGFRAALGDIVLFMDDDILPPPTLLRQHADAHRARPGSVIFGSCPFIEPHAPTPLSRYLEEPTTDYTGKDACPEFIPRTIVASGQLSVERSSFGEGQGVYHDGLATPAAEELELSFRLRERGIAVLHAPRIVARHDHLVNLDFLCRQQYKHAIGYAEVAAKCPGALGLPELHRVIAANGPVTRRDSFHQALKKVLKRIATTQIARWGLPRLAWWAEALVPYQPLLRRLYTAAISAHFCAGVRDGLREYAGVAPCRQS